MMGNKTERLRVLESARKSVLLDIPLEQAEQKEEGVWVLPFQALALPRGITAKKRWGWQWPLGFIRWMDLRYPDGGMIQNVLWRFFPLNPRYLFYWGKLGLRSRKSTILIVERYADQIAPVGLKEREIRDPERIRGLLEHSLSYVDQREEGSSKLYKDPKDGRFWQFYEKEGQAILYQVNAMQWQYRYLENRLAPEKEGPDEEKEFYSSLEEDQTYQCTEKNCQRPSVKFSSLCRDHHFEAIKGHPPDPQWKGPQ